MSLAPFFILLGLLIFVHELGHFAVAKWFGVRVEVFSLGFGKKILQYRWGDTVYCISMIPLGGYVKMFGDDPTADIPEGEKKHSFLHKPLWPRTAVVLAGPLMNLFFTVPLFMGVALIGQDVPSSRLGMIESHTDAHKAGFRSHDKILRINGGEVQRWQQVDTIMEASANQSLSFDVDRAGEAVHIKATPELVHNPFIFSRHRQIGHIEGLSSQARAPLVAVRDEAGFLRQSGFGVLEWVAKVNNTPITTYGHLIQILKALPPGQRAQFDLVSKLDNLQDIELPIEAGQTRQVVVENWPVGGMQHTGFEIEGDTAPPGNIESLFSSPELFLARVIDKTPAHQAGLQQGDELVAINGHKLNEWEDVLERVKDFGSSTSTAAPSEGATVSKGAAATAQAKKSLEFTVRRDGHLQTLHITPRMTELPTAQGQMEKRYTVGIAPAFVEVASEYVNFRHTNIWQAFKYGVRETIDWTGVVVISFVRLFQGEVSARNIGGVITIGVAAKESFSDGAVSFLIMMAIISLNLFLINLLPIPVLDGGHLMFFLIEAIKGSPVSVQKIQAAYQVGFVVLIAFMAFALFNDITNLLRPW